MIFIRQILRWAPMGQLSRSSAYKSTAFRLQGKTVPNPWPFTTRLSFTLRMWLLVATIPFRLRRATHAAAIQYNDGNTRERRLYYFKKHAQLQCRDEQVLSCHPEGWRMPLYYKELGLSKLVLLWRIGFLLQWAAWVSLWYPTRVNPHWKMRFAQLLLQQVLFHAPGRQQLLYFCYEPETYLSTLLATAYLPDYEPQVVSSNSVLFRDNRYLYNPRLHLRICSQFQQHETAAYATRGWMQVRDITLWGLEEANVFDKLTPTPPTYDLGIYSSAGWARTHDLWRSEDLNQLRQGGYPTNPLFVELTHILHTVCEFLKTHPIKVKFYLHPHEVHLLRDHGIRPPYLDLLEAHGITYSLTDGPTIERIYEARVGLAVSSTLLFDRMHLGLRSYFYGGPRIPDNTIDIRFLGQYARYGYHDEQALAHILLQEFEPTHQNPAND